MLCWVFIDRMIEHKSFHSEKITARVPLFTA